MQNNNANALPPPPPEYPAQSAQPIDLGTKLFNPNFNQGEQLLWVHTSTKGLFNKTMTENWVITNQRAIKYFPPSQTNTRGALFAVDLGTSDVVVMNRFSSTNGERIGSFYATSVGRITVGSGHSSYQSHSRIYGDLIFLTNGQESFRFNAVSDPNGIVRIIKAIVKQSTKRKKKIS